MPRNGSGTYTLPAGNPVVTGTTISSTWANTTLSDIGTGLTNSIAKDGQTTPTANLPMGGFKHTGVAVAAATTDYARADQVQNSETQWLTSVSGTNTITASSSITPAAYAAGQTFRFIAAGANTTAVTINVSGLGAKNLKKRMSGGLVDLVSRDLVYGIEYSITYDGTQFVLNEQRPYSHGADVASASTINLDTATGDCVDITGTTTINAITLSEGEERTTRFTGILTLTNGAALVLITGANITTAAGDYAVWRGYASGIVRMVSYTKANGTPLAVPSTSGVWVLVDSDTASSSASISLTGYNSTIHGDVRITGKNVTVSSDGANITLRTSTNGGSSYDSGASDYRYGAPYYIVGSSVTADGSNGTNAISLTSNIGVGNAAGEFCNFEISVPNPGAASPCAIFADVQGINASGASFTVNCNGCRVASADVDAFQIIPSAGNLAGGTFEMWALLK